MQTVRTGAFGAVVAVTACMLAAACSPNGKFGKPISPARETPILDITSDPESFKGRTVMVRGQIATVDGDGMGFNLDNGRSVLLYVKVAGDFKISKVARYRLATAEGVVEVDAKSGKPQLRATGVEVK